jgi:hypothetical protein
MIASRKLVLLGPGATRTPCVILPQPGWHEALASALLTEAPIEGFW